MGNFQTEATSLSFLQIDKFALKNWLGGCPLDSLVNLRSDDKKIVTDDGWLSVFIFITPSCLS